jgi:amino acid adenylation domain-containing protein
MTGMESSSELRQRLLERLRTVGLPTTRQAADSIVQLASSSEAIPLSCGQQQIWLHSKIAPDAPIYNESITIRKIGFMDPMVLERCFNEIVRRHAIWRTGFSDSSGEIAQVVYPHVHVALPLIDLSSLQPAEAVAEALRLAGKDASDLFDLSRPPLLRARLIRLRSNDHRLYLTFHHLIFDGVSIYRVFLPELANLYRHYSLGQPSSLPDLSIQYGDYARYQQRKVAKGDYAHQLSYWREALSGDVPPVELSVGKSLPAAPSWRAGMETFVMSARLLQALKNFAAVEGATLYITLLAAFHILLHRYTQQPGITTGSVVSVRNRPELEPLIGFLLNTVVLRSHVDSRVPFRDFLKQIRNTVLDALANSEVPFDTVVRELAPKRDSRRNAFFQVLFSLRPSSNDFPAGWDLTELDVHSGASGFALFVDIVERPDTLMGRIIYSSDLFDGAAIARMAGHLLTLLEGVVEDPGLPVALLPLLTGDERENVLSAGIGSCVEIPAVTISALFEEQAMQRPDRIAVIFQGQQLTFQELDRRANVFAAKLRHAGAKPGSLVSIGVDRSLEMLIAVVGVLKVGAAYLPIDPNLPAERREFILNDAKPHLQITSKDLTITGCHCEDFGHYAGLAYLLYTSGSTGVPKGVEVPETAVINFLCSMQREPGFSSSDILLAVTTLSFDIAVLELILPLVSGGILVIAPREAVSDPECLIETIHNSKCTVMQGTPAVWRSLIDAGWRGDSQLKILCGGEALSRSLADELLQRCRELWNMYGPTETTIWSTVQKIEPGPEPVCIGRPIDNTQVYVLDRNLQLLPTGTAGELYISGSGVARGYVARQTLTDERFLPNPFLAGQRMYRTGDHVRWGSSGALEFLGRLDNQVKVRGYRVEIQEIEEALVKCPGVRAAAVKAWADASGENALVAYVEGRVDTSALRRYLARTMPEYMIPSRFIELQELPLTPNGKLDRKRLPEPGRHAASAGEPAEPRNDTERRMETLWTTLLNIASPDVNQDFFTLGGHSLLAANLLRRIDVEFGQRLSIATLFENPTIAKLSAVLDKAATRPGEFDEKASSEQRYLYWMYAGEDFRRLAIHLRPTYDLHGVWIPPELEKNICESDRFEDVAALIVNQMLRNPPKGPYYLGGWCISGILAYEVAVQLTALGKDVGLVALLGAPNPQHYSAIPKSERFKSKLRHHWKQLACLDMAGVSRYLAERLRQQMREHNVLGPRPFEHVLLQLAMRYEPKPLRARVCLFQGVERPSVIDYTPGWTGVVKGEFTAYDVPGNHATSLEEPHVTTLAEKLRGCLG